MKIALDKKQHAMGSALMVVVFSMLMPLLYAAGLAFVIGVSKELIHDLALKRGTPDIWDVAANIAGITMASLLLFAWEIKF